MAKFLAMKSAEWRNRKTDKQWKAALEAYANPVIGKLPVDQIDKAHIRLILEPIWTTKTVTATRVRGRIESILSWATHRGYRTGENPARWADNLEHELPAPSKIHAGGHFRALAIDELPPFMAKLRAREGMAARALEFVILTAARSGEVRGARWDEIDMVKRLWSVPAGRMKSNRAHTVPLSDAAIRVLKGVARSTANAELVFPAPRGGPLSDMALTAVLRRMNVEATVHGFRSTFRDWGAERTAYPHIVAEQALAHSIEDKTVAAYLRSDLLVKRKLMMADWASFAESQPSTKKVVKFRRGG